MSFKLQLEQFAEKAGAKAEEKVREIAFEVYARVVTKSPVDTGRFRGNWNMSLGGLDKLVSLESFDKEGRKGLVAAEVTLTRYHGGKIFISNSLPYAFRLEDGYSQQAPVGMVRTTLTEINDIVKRVVNSV